MLGQKTSKALKEDLWPELLLRLATSGNSDTLHKETCSLEGELIEVSLVLTSFSTQTTETHIACVESHE